MQIDNSAWRIFKKAEVKVDTAFGCIYLKGYLQKLYSALLFRSDQRFLNQATQKVIILLSYHSRFSIVLPDMVTLRKLKFITIDYIISYQSSTHCEY